MGSKGGFILLLILAVLCHSGHSLKCYTCADGETCNRTTVCSVNHDSCLLVKAEPRLFYRQCWKLDECSYLSISKALGLKNLEYSCCQKDLCNGSARVSGMTMLMLFPLLAAALTLCL